MFSWEFSEILKNTFFIEYLRGNRFCKTELFPKNT